LDIDISRSTEDTLLEDGRDLRSLGLGRSVVADGNGGSTKVETSLNDGRSISKYKRHDGRGERMKRVKLMKITQCSCSDIVA
jgi:hypothetical protein